MRAGEATLEPMQHEAQGFQIEIVFAQEPDFTRPQAVSVGEEEQGAVALVVADA
jgi:hypothetical protein